jgi:hemoglobin-like flavoprotein
MMTPNQISLVRDTWQRVIPIQQQAAMIFYDKLFAPDPSLRALFKGDFEEQKLKLMKMIGIAVSSLDRLDDIMPGLKSLGARHDSYGVKPKHYATVGVALLGASETGLGSAFTPDVKAAWTGAYIVLSQSMQTAATDTTSAHRVAPTSPALTPATQPAT